MRTRSHPSPLAWRLPLLALGVALFLGACAANPEPGTPKLPPGFLEAEMPTGELSGYLYMSQDPSPTVSLDLFGDVPAQGVSTEATIGSVTGWVGPNLEAFGGRAAFTESDPAELALMVLSSRENFEAWREGNNVLFVRGANSWAEAIESALRSGDTQRFQDARPETWELMRLLPPAPPVDPVAAGFASVSGDVLDGIASRTDMDLGGLGQAFGAINVTEIAFAAYADDVLRIPGQVNRDFLSSARVGAIFVARSTYPGFLLSFFLNSFSDQVGLQEGPTISGEAVLSKELEGMHLLVKPLGNTIFLSIAPSPEMAEALLASAIGPHVGG